MQNAMYCDVVPHAAPVAPVLPACLQMASHCLLFGREHPSSVCVPSTDVPVPPSGGHVVFLDLDAKFDMVKMQKVGHGSKEGGGADVSHELRSSAHLCLLGTTRVGVFQQAHHASSGNTLAPGAV